MAGTRRFILFELNEVPLRVVRHFADRHANSAFAKASSGSGRSRSAKTLPLLSVTVISGIVVIPYPFLMCCIHFLRSP